MPTNRTRQLSEEEKYRRAKRKVDEILQQHSLEYIKSKRSEYNLLRREGIIDTSLWQFNNLYNKYEQLCKFIVEYELSLGPTRCENCQRYVLLFLSHEKYLFYRSYVFFDYPVYRMEIDRNIHPYYRIEFVEKYSSTLSTQKFKNVVAYSGQNSRTYCLCRECSNYLDILAKIFFCSILITDIVHSNSMRMGKAWYCFSIVLSRFIKMMYIGHMKISKMHKVTWCLRFNIASTLIYLLHFTFCCYNVILYE